MSSNLHARMRMHPRCLVLFFPGRREPYITQNQSHNPEVSSAAEVLMALVVRV
jgi:hypothetical protein